jgi:4-hydroxyphenylacetate 3-monooxygenase
MGARSGNNYLSALKKLGAEIWLDNERIRDVTSHQAFASRARATASLYDMQIENPEAMTFRTVDGGRAGLSFMQPRNAEELRKRGKMIKTWADYTCGFPADTPEVANVSLAAMDAAREFFGANDSRRGENLQKYYGEARDHDWRATETLPNPGVGKTGFEGAVAAEALRTVERNDAGLVVSGSRRLPTSAPLCEELLILPSTTLEAGPAAETLANVFAIPCNAKGLRIICRDPDRSPSDHPLRRRFDQLECIAVFDRVVVPWERVFLSGDVARCNAVQSSTSAALHRAYLATLHNLATAEFLLGLAAGIAHTGAEIVAGCPRAAGANDRHHRIFADPFARGASACRRGSVGRIRSCTSTSRGRARSASGFVPATGRDSRALRRATSQSGSACDHA